jgi:hypothetical protein
MRAEDEHFLDFFAVEEQTRGLKGIHLTSRREADHEGVHVFSQHLSVVPENKKFLQDQ